jgi:hypothetical protein
MKPDWQEAAAYAMFASVFIVVASRSVFWRKPAFWVSLVISSAVHFVIVHHWTQRVPHLSRSEGKGAVFLGFLLFLAVYGFVSLLRRIFHGKGANDNTETASVRVSNPHSIS